MTMRRIYGAMGMASSVCYLCGVLIGGFLAEGGYNHLVHAISELPHYLPARYAGRIEAGFALYGWLLLLFSVASAIDLYRNRHKPLALVAIMLGINALAGLFMTIYPMDARETEATLQGQVHLILAAVCAVTSFGAPILTGILLRKWHTLHDFVWSSLLFGAVILVSGGLTAAGAANQFSYFGLIERITIGSFVLWSFLFAWRLPAALQKEKA